MSKRTTFTNISPLPSTMTREQALGFLHNHLEMIDLNPLVIERHKIDAPPHALEGEKNCTWYSLTDKIEYLPGGAVSGNVSYTCAFHDMPDGLQTHCYAPMGTDIRDRWTVAGTMPGEPPQPMELGLGAPKQGLYLREDVELRCNFLMSSFVKKTLSKSHGKLVDTLVEKASKLPAGGTPGSVPYAPAYSPGVSVLGPGVNGLYTPPTLGGQGQSNPQQRWSNPEAGLGQGQPQSGLAPPENPHRPLSIADSQQYSSYSYNNYPSHQPQQPYHIPQYQGQSPTTTVSTVSPWDNTPQHDQGWNNANGQYGAQQHPQQMQYQDPSLNGGGDSMWPAPLNFKSPTSPNCPTSIHMGFAELGGEEGNYKLQNGGPVQAQEMPTDYHSAWHGQHNATNGQVNGHGGQSLTAGHRPAELA